MFPEFSIEFCLWLLAMLLTRIIKVREYKRIVTFYLIFILTNHSIIYTMLVFAAISFLKLGERFLKATLKNMKKAVKL